LGNLVSQQLICAGTCSVKTASCAFVNVYLNDDDIRYPAKEATLAKDTDTITIVPSVAGGMTARLSNPTSRAPPITGDHSDFID
jgi:hypothetical protein